MRKIFVVRKHTVVETPYIGVKRDKRERESGINIGNHLIYYLHLRPNRLCSLRLQIRARSDLVRDLRCIHYLCCFVVLCNVHVLPVVWLKLVLVVSVTLMSNGRQYSSV